MELVSGPATPAVSRWPRCAPTRSASMVQTWSAACWRSARAVGSSAWAGAVLAAAVRDPAVAVDSRTVTLEEVGYPPDDQLASRAAEARQVRSR
ncbi:MAG: hypothetical protein R2734_13160 [Nocardioides sp.]